MSLYDVMILIRIRIGLRDVRAIRQNAAAQSGLKGTRDEDAKGISCKEKEKEVG